MTPTTALERLMRDYRTILADYARRLDDTFEHMLAEDKYWTLAEAALRQDDKAQLEALQKLSISYWEICHFLTQPPHESYGAARQLLAAQGYRDPNEGQAPA